MRRFDRIATYVALYVSVWRRGLSSFVQSNRNYRHSSNPCSSTEERASVEAARHEVSIVDASKNNVDLAVLGSSSDYEEDVVALSEGGEQRMLQDADDAPCSPNTQRKWVVRDAATVDELAAAVACSGGMFDVTWEGMVVVDRAIKITGGTALNVTGIGSKSGMEGAGANRFFTVTNASLYVSRMQFSNGTADVGGAIFAVEGSNISLSETNFMHNVAFASGGAMHIANDSSALLSGNSQFIQNRATSYDGLGGALFIDGASGVNWSGNANFSENEAAHGGAVLVRNGSTASWEAGASFVGNKAQRLFGGAVFVSRDSMARWEGNTHFAENEATLGGALSVLDARISWFGSTTFIHNSAHNGGALDVRNKASVLWEGETVFRDNAARSGGAMYAVINSTVSWEAKTSFSNNSAQNGGALYLTSQTNVSAQAETIFSNNVAKFDGGAVYLDSAAGISWFENTTFLTNAASHDGGAVYCSEGSRVSWAGEMSFLGNNVDSSGGALYVTGGSHVSWNGDDTKLVDNAAKSYGGAVYVDNAAEEFRELEHPTSLEINGTTSFEANRCEGSGGGMAVLGGLSVTFETTQLTFRNNSASISGGGMFLSGVGIGPQLTGTTFGANRARVGAGLFSTGTGTTVTFDKTTGVAVQHPTIFQRCTFLDNEAMAAGGAMESGAGVDVFIDTSFVRNTAGIGGALRLGGTASLDNCTFVENTSAEDAGPAVSNIGVILEMINGSFVDNVFDCPLMTYLEYEVS
ncbi:unnamed protein product, partial [Sphacelaria rigidula]